MRSIDTAPSCFLFDLRVNDVAASQADYGYQSSPRGMQQRLNVIFRVTRNVPTLNRNGFSVVSVNERCGQPRRVKPFQRPAP
jgi:hypothetical protein